VPPPFANSIGGDCVTEMLAVLDTVDDIAIDGVEVGVEN